MSDAPTSKKARHRGPRKVEGGSSVKLSKRKAAIQSANASRDTTDAPSPATAAAAAYAPPAEMVGKYVRGQTIKTNTKDKKLATHLTTLANQQKSSAAAAYEHDSLLLPQDASGRIEVEDELERTWKVGQSDIAESVGQGAASNSFTLELGEFGPYEADYTSNGRHLAIAGRRGHVATFDWHTGALGTELHLKETVRDIKWLHNTSFFAVAQKKYVYIYDSNGLEIHQLRNHIEVNRMQFLRYHFLLATVGNPGFLKYQDTSTGSIVAEHRTRLGPCSVMAQNQHSGVLSLGHSNGTVTMWTPNLSTAQVKLLAHSGPVTAIAHDPSSMGTYFATTGLNGSMKVWDMRKWEAVNEWQLRRPATSVSYSQKGLLAVGWGNHTTIYADSSKRQGSRVPGPYMTNLFPSTAVQGVTFCPFEDVLGVGHSKGFSSLIIPGAGKANYDSLEADPFESKKSRREREVISLLDKIQPDQIHMDTDLIGRLEARTAEKSALDSFEAGSSLSRPRQKTKSFAAMSRLEKLKAAGADVEEDDEGEDGQAEAEELAEGKAKKPRGKNKVLKRILRRKKNIIDAKTMRIKELQEERRQKAKAARSQASKDRIVEDSGALSRFQ